MIKIENVEVIGWKHAIRGMRNPMNSWDKSDSHFGYMYPDDYEPKMMIGDNDLDLMKRLRKAGTDHRKYMRMITVYADITAPLYWWKEFDTYKVGTVANSCSTMHKMHAKEFTLDDFSCEHLFNDFTEDIIDSLGETIEDFDGTICAVNSMDLISMTIRLLNAYRDKFIETKDKKYWLNMIQLLPSSYNQKRTVMLNYEVLANIYKSRKSHKLDEWREFCKWIEQLPYSELITGEFEDENN